MRFSPGPTKLSVIPGLIFVIRENEISISVIRDSLFFSSVNRARDPPCTTLYKRWKFKGRRIIKDLNIKR